MTHQETRLKRLRLRCWRRGMREMDLVLGGFADDRASDLTEAKLDQLEALMEENDQDIYPWITGASEPPSEHQEIIKEISNYLGKSERF